MQKLIDLFHSQNTLDNAQTSLQKLFEALQESEPKLRRRELAEQLEISEAALIDCQCGLQSIRLKDDFAGIINSLENLGYIMSLTRNDSAVHERKGCYQNVSVKGPMGLVISDDRKIDLRIIVSRWASGYAVQESVKDGHRYSLQFFDQAGIAIQKIYLQAESNLEAYCHLIEQFNGEFSELATYTKVTDLPEYVDSSSVDKSALISEWEKMTNVHQFFGILRKYKISREQAFKIVGAPLAQPFEPLLIEQLLHDIADTDLSIMCFVGNRGNIQIHTGAIETVKRMGPWLNILDPEFNLHLLIDRVASGWVISKPTEDGNVTSLELYDDEGETIAQFFGQRVEGQPENRQWYAFTQKLLEDSKLVSFNGAAQTLKVHGA
jgi:putative hemin transport protein